MSSVLHNQVFSAVHTVGGLLPVDVLVSVSEGGDMSGCAPADNGITGSRSVRDEAERHWDCLRSRWGELRKHLPVAREDETPTDSTGLAITGWLAPLFVELGFGELTPVGAAGITSDDGRKTFPISHRWNHVPIHLVAWHVDLDKKPGPGMVPPQSLVQECLNRTDAHLWGVLTNGRRLRLLRDCSALATSSYVEFDLEAIFDGELFSEFVLLYRLLHVSRFATAPDAPPSTCWLERWRTEAIESGTRALDQLRDGVQKAIDTLGTGFLRHLANTRLRENLDIRAFHTALLRLVYRLLFVFVAEDRDVLHDPNATEQARDRYARYFSTARLRAQARRRRGTTHSDLYQALRIVLDALGSEHGRPELGLPGLGGLFDDTDADAPLRGLVLSDEYLLTAIRHLVQVYDPATKRWRAIDYRNLDAEELGSIYESLLELKPELTDQGEFRLVTAAGHTRKTTGSYYTPSSLIARLLDTTLDPVIEDAVKRAEQKATAAGLPDPTDTIVDELLSLTVCDPACGSGRFLVAAARRIAKRVAAVREGNPEPTLPAVRRALHEVIARCIYGVDLNPMAVELAKVSLWLEALEPGKPLSFLDAHIKCGNSLLGTTPKLLKDGIPDAAFSPIEGDDKTITKSLKKRNRTERAGRCVLPAPDTDKAVPNTTLAAGLRRITDTAAETPAHVRHQASAYRELARSEEYRQSRHVADAWCAAFLWPKHENAPPAVTHAVFLALHQPHTAAVPRRTHDEIVRLREQYRFFHWHLEFPEVFTVPDTGVGADDSTGWTGGFDCVLGNPPWERIKLQEQEFFAQRDPLIATARTAAERKKLIAKLKHDPRHSALHQEFLDAKRRAEGESHFLRTSRLHPLTGRGDINTYAVFAETGRRLIKPHGRLGMIVPTGIATDATTQYFYRDVTETGSLAALFDFENTAPLFPGVHRSFKFCILSLVGRALRERAARFAFFLHDPAELDDPNRTFTLTPEEVTLLNPNTGTCPIFRSRRDAEITLGIYRRVPVFVEEPDRRGRGERNRWGVSFVRMFDMANDSHLFRARDELEADGWRLLGNVFVKGAEAMLPLYEAKMVEAFNHRAADVVKSPNATKRQNQPSYLGPAEWRNPTRTVVPASWVAQEEIPEGSPPVWLAFLRVSSPTNQRTMISTLLPRAAVGDSVFLVETRSVTDSAILTAMFNAFVFDFVARQKVAGLNLSFFYVKQLPVLEPAVAARFQRFLLPRVLELTYTADDMAPFARALGDTLGPFRWDDQRRAVIRAELDALFFHLYGIARDDVDYIMDTFPIVKRNDEATYGTYRTKELILAEYDRMTAAGVSPDAPLLDGSGYTSTLTPPPGHGPRHPRT